MARSTVLVRDRFLSGLNQSGIPPLVESLTFWRGMCRADKTACANSSVFECRLDLMRYNPVHDDWLHLRAAENPTLPVASWTGKAGSFQYVMLCGIVSAECIGSLVTEQVRLVTCPRCAALDPYPQNNPLRKQRSGD